MADRREDRHLLRLVRDVRPTGGPTVHEHVRTAKLASVPVMFAGRRALGAGKRALGRSADEVQQDIQMRTAQHIFEVLGELRGCAAKLGQILSLYEMALPVDVAAPYRRALAQLQDSAPAMLPRAVHGALADSMGRSWRDSFLEFDDQRPKAASIGQVHKAVWRDGRPVAVKIQYPGARQAVQSDLLQLRRISALMGVFLPGADIDALTDEICARILEELDYAHEADNQRAFAEAFADDPEFVVPKVIAQSGDVIVSEWVGGTSLTKVVEWGGPQTERDRIGEQVLRFAVTGPRRCGILYGDPHPGNYRALPDGRLGVVDFGACAVLPADFAERALDVTNTMLNGDLDELEAMIRRRGFVQPGRDFDVRQLDKVLDPIAEAFAAPDFRLTPDWLRARVVESTDLRLTNVYRQLTVSADLIAFARMYLSLTGLLAQLNARVSVPAACAQLIPGFAECHARATRRRGPRDTVTSLR